MGVFSKVIGIKTIGKMESTAMNVSMDNRCNQESMGKVTKGIKNYALILILFAYSTIASASETIYERVNFAKATHEEIVEDMRVKVLGGHISVQRFYRVMKQYPAGGPSDINVGVSGAIGPYVGNSLRASAANGDFLDQQSEKRYDTGVWQFHRKWHDLIFLNAAATSARLTPDAIKYIDRNDYIYERKKDTDYFEYEHNGADLRITMTDYGYRWTNRDGDWIDYNHDGLATASGDKNNVTITLVRNENGLIHQYKDHLDRVVLSWTYAGVNPASVTDYTGRTVNYTWEGRRLVGVEDTLGNDWSYGYDDFGEPIPKGSYFNISTK